MRGAPAQEVRSHDEIGIDDRDHVGPHIRHLERVVQGPGLEPRPVLQVYEAEPGAFAVLLDRSPQSLVLGVVVDHENLEIGVVQVLEAAQGLDDELGRLVMDRNVDRDERQIRWVEWSWVAPMPPDASRDVEGLVGPDQEQHEREDLQGRYEQCGRDRGARELPGQREDDGEDRESNAVRREHAEKGLRRWVPVALQR
jgi:hypothetical protein